MLCVMHRAWIIPAMALLAALAGCADDAPPPPAPLPAGERAVTGRVTELAMVSSGVAVRPVAPAFARGTTVHIPVTGGIVAVPGLARGAVEHAGGLRLTRAGRGATVGGLRLDLASGMIIGQTPAGTAVSVVRLVGMRADPRGIRARAVLTAEGAALVGVVGEVPLGAWRTQLSLSDTQRGGAGPGPAD